MEKQTKYYTKELLQRLKSCYRRVITNNNNLYIDSYLVYIQSITI